jgi:putative glutamine amidotransferase
VPDLVGHDRHTGPKTGFGRHSVEVAEGSLLSAIQPSGEFFDVPTHHHQAIDLLGDGLAAVAWEEDGLIEAVEAGPTELGGVSGFVLGVQWHPEQGTDPALFAALIAAAAERAAARAAGLAPMV